MSKIFNKRKDYIVGIISNNKTELVQVKAQNKKEAMEMVTDVLLKCPIFGFKTINDFELNCRRIRNFKESIKKIGFFFMKGRRIYE